MAKTIDPTKKTPTQAPVQVFRQQNFLNTSKILFAINGFDGAINGINSLINSKKTAFAKSNSPQTRKHLYFH